MIERLLPAGPNHQVRVRCSQRADGDFHVDLDPTELADRRQRFAPGEWTWLRQVHGSAVVDVRRPGDGAGSEADSSVTSVTGAVLAVQSADCVPVVLSASGVVAVAHAGWRGVVEGVVPAAVAALRERSDGPVTALVGPHIRVGNYEFGEAELAAVAAISGDGVRGRTAAGAAALDMTEAIRATLHSADVDEIEILEGDTADPGWFSHRVRADRERQVTVAWLESLDD